MLLSADFIRRCHRVNGLVAFCYGFAVNVLLIVLVMQSKLVSYKRLLFQMSIIDCSFLILAGITDPVAMFADGVELVLQNGFFRFVPNPWNMILTTLWVAGLYFTIFSLCVQFIYRYLLLCRSYKLPLALFFGILMVPVVAAIGIGICYFLAFSYDAHDEREFTLLLADLMLEPGETSIHPSGIARTTRNMPLFILMTIACSMFAINYGIIAFCVIKINKTLNNMSSHVKQSTRALHHQLSIVLFVQATLPLGVSVLPVAYFFYIIFTHGSTFYPLVLFTGGFNWIPCINATVTLLCVQRFRRKLNPIRFFSIDKTANARSKILLFIKSNNNNVLASETI